jgi:hypothetical protein
MRVFVKEKIEKIAIKMEEIKIQKTENRGQMKQAQ